MPRLRCSLEETERILAGVAAVTEPSGGDPAEFQLDLALDVERERLLLYRIVLVLEFLAAALLARQALLWYFVR